MKNEESIRDVVRQRYGKLAAEGGSCCGPAKGQGQTDWCCHGGYAPEDLVSLDTPTVSSGLGCGNPVSLAGLKPGEVVLDLGSGGGLDVFLAATRVGPAGRVIGVDMTPEMLARAKANAERLGLANVEFRQGLIEALPVEDASVDVILSNCVINLAPDKAVVFTEAFRALKSGGRLVVSDMVTKGDLPAAIREDPDLWAACIGGAIPEEEYLGAIRRAGFAAVEVVGRSGSEEGPVYSVTVRAEKPGGGGAGTPSRTASS